MHLKCTASEGRSQAFRIGCITLKPGPGSTGAAILPVSIQDDGTWRISGLLRITPQDIGVRHWPTTRRDRGRRRFIRQALQAARRALGA